MSCPSQPEICSAHERGYHQYLLKPDTENVKQYCQTTLNAPNGDPRIDACIAGFNQKTIFRIPCGERRSQSFACELLPRP
jgi:hypothetical protein